MDHAVCTDMPKRWRPRHRSCVFVESSQDSVGKHFQFLNRWKRACGRAVNSNKSFFLFFFFSISLIQTKLVRPNHESKRNWFPNSMCFRSIRSLNQRLFFHLILPFPLCLPHSPHFFFFVCFNKSNRNQVSPLLFPSMFCQPLTSR